MNDGITFTIQGRCPTKGSTAMTAQKPESDIPRVMSYLTPLLRGYDTSEIVAFVHEGAPVSKARARWHRKQQRFYTPDSSTGAQDALSWKFKQVVKGEPWKGNIAIAVVFFRPNHQRIDGDNLMKLVLDAGTTAGIWGDDCQVTHQVSVIEKDTERPRTVIALSAVASSLDRHQTIEFTCQRCLNPFTRLRTEVIGRTIKFCSAECRNLSAVKASARCPKCDVKFVRKRSGQRYCSNACRLAPGLHRKPGAKQRPPAVCGQCGTRVSRREYLFCAGCRRKGRKPGAKNKPRAA
jgi:Holliday junction resolvase RusA-like endonuclease